MSTYDVVVIGSGPGGYVCAIRCAQLGLKTAIVEKYKTLGGTCLNVGCIPSKAWLDSSEKFHQAEHEFEDHGIGTGKLSLNFKKMRERVEKVVADTCGGVAFLMKKNKIDVLTGVGSFKDSNTLEVAGKVVSFKHAVIATGSKPSTLPGLEIDKERIITSTEALYLDQKPKSAIIIGGGVIGVELGQVFNRLGTEVSVVEFAPSLIGAMDADLGKELGKVFKKSGIDLKLSHAVEKVERKGKGVVVTARNTKNDEVITLEAEYCIVAVGRRPFTEGLGLDKIGVELDERGRVPTNEHLQTKHKHIYAIGDVVKGTMLAHKAEEEGVFVAETIKGQKPHVDYNLIPGVVYTWPEVASVGKTEQELKNDGTPYKKGAFPFKASGRARASNESDGFIKILAHKETDEILGVHMIGPRAADMIAEGVVAMEFRASAEDVARMSHAHPTYTESIREAALAATENRPLHI